MRIKQLKKDKLKTNINKKFKKISLFELQNSPKYLKSAVFEDNLCVETAVLKKTNVRLNLLQEVKRGEEVLVSAEVELAVVDRSGSIKKLSKDFFAKI